MEVPVLFSPSSLFLSYGKRLTFQPIRNMLPDVIQPFAPRVGTDGSDLLVQLGRSFEDVRREELRSERVGDEVGVFEKSGDL